MSNSVDIYEHMYPCEYYMMIAQSALCLGLMGVFVGGTVWRLYDRVT